MLEQHNGLLVPARPCKNRSRKSVFPAETRVPAQPTHFHTVVFDPGLYLTEPNVYTRLQIKNIS